MSNTMKNVLKFLPLALVLVVGGLYMIFDFFYVECKNGGAKCTDVNGAMISHVKNPITQQTGKKRLNEIDNELNAFSQGLSNKQSALTNTQEKIHLKEIEIANMKIANVNLASDPIAVKKANDNSARLTAEKDLYTVEKTQSEHAVNTVNGKITAVSSEASAIRSQFSVRYSNRMLWVFLSAVLTMLCIASIICTAFVIYRSQRFLHEPEIAAEKMRQWLIMPTILSAIFIILGISFPGLFDSIGRSVLQTSVIAVNEISQRTIVFFITVTFASSLFLILASCAVSAAGLETKTAHPPEKKDGDGKSVAPTDEETNLWRRKVYSGLLRHLKTILYVGTALLIVGIARLYFLNEWHLAFVSADAATPLKKFFESSMQMQGALYSIMLAAIYLAPAYWIREDGVAIPAPQTADPAINSLDFSYSNILVKLLAILSPLILGSVGGELLKVFQ